MQIIPVNNYIFFKGKRDDHNTIKKLSNSSNPINENLQINMSNALDTLSKDASVENIKFLLATARNLNYGIKNNSEFKKKLLQNSPLKDNAKLSNFNWEQSLKQATRSALDLNQSLQKDELEKNYRNVFDRKSRLTNVQKDILQYRDKIINSYILKNNIAQNNPAMVNNVKKNIDYFIFSSEISQDDKAECLMLLSNFASSKYKINFQLKDKKLQILDEILNDINIKTPEAEALTIKAVNQKRHGMCAAIAACRKLAAYQDKVNYVDNIMEELNSSPYMYIYDITQLGSGRKIPVKKVHIDFDDAIKRGYRIIDASTTQWMHNANRTGDGTDITSYYIPFDEENHELYKDSFWLSNFPESMGYARAMLKNSIKARSYIEDIEKYLVHKESIMESIGTKKSNLMLQLSDYQVKFKKLLTNIIPCENGINIEELSSRILNLDNASKRIFASNYNITSSEKELYRINPSEPDEIKKSKIIEFIIDNTNLSKDKVSENIDKIFNLYSDIKTATNELSSINKINNEANITRSYYKNLFLFTVAYQKVIEANLENPQYVYSLINQYNITNSQSTILKHFDNIISELESDNCSDDIDLNYLAEILNSKPDKAKILSSMKKFKNDFNNTTNKSYDNICKRLGLKNTKGLVLATINAYLSQVNLNDKTEIAKLSDKFKVNPNRFAVTNKLTSLIDDIKTNNYNGDLKEVLDYFQIKNLPLFLMLIIQAVSKLNSSQNDDVEYVKTPMYFMAKHIVDNAAKNNINLNNEIPYISADITALQENIEVIEEGFNVPQPPELVWNKFQKDGLLISEEDLDSLDKKFLEIEQLNDKLDKSKLNNERLRFPGMYTFSEQQKEILKRMERNYTQAKHYINRTYRDLNLQYKDKIDAAYRAAGLSDGSFWIREEGSTGLNSGKQVKIIEQMTGKPYYIEKNLMSAIKKIKEGIGGGEISTRVSPDNMYSAHAQFTPGITSIKYKDAQTGKEITKEVLWFDNSWGRSERNEVWKDVNGVSHTDYGAGYGSENGFILRNNDLIGLDTEFLLYGKGIHEPTLIHNQKEQKVNKYVGEEYQIFDDIILPGQSPLSKKNSKKIIDDIFDIQNDKLLLNGLINKIENGHFPNMKKYGDNIDDIAVLSVRKLLNKAMNIKSEAEFSALPENDELKIILQKMAILDTSYGEANNAAVNLIHTVDDINDYNSKLLNKLKQFTMSYLGHSNKLYKQEDLTNDLKQCVEKFSKRNKLELSELLKSINIFFDIDKAEINSKQTYQNLCKDNIYKIVNKLNIRKLNKKELASKLCHIVDKYYNDNFSADLLFEYNEFAPILKFLDNKYDPVSNEDAKNLVNKLRHTPHKEIAKIINNTTLADFGVTYNEPYHYLKSLQTHNWDVASDFNDVATKFYITKLLPETKKIKVALDSKFDKVNNLSKLTTDELYRVLMISLSYAEIEKSINQQKNEVFQKYSVREAFPVVRNYDTDKIQELITNNLTNISIRVDKLKSLKQTYDFIDLLNDYQKAYELNNDITKEYFENSIIPILQAIDNNEHKSNIGIDVPNLVNNIIFNADKYDLDTIKNNLSELHNKIVELKKDYSKEIILNQKMNEVKNINNMIKYFAKTFIVHKKKQDEFIHLLHEYVRQYSKNPLCEKQENIINKIHELANKYVFFKTPQLLLDEFLKLKIQDVKNKSKEHDKELNSYKDALDTLLDAANYLDLEYKILEEIDSGRIYDLKNNIENYYITLQDNTKVKLLSQNGLSALFTALYNEADKNHMEPVNLLSRNTGLSEDFFNALVHKYDFSSHKKDSMAFYNKLYKTVAELKVVNKVYNKIIKNTDCEYEDLATNYIEELYEAFSDNIRCRTFQIYKRAFLKLTPSLLEIVGNIKKMPAVDYKQKRQKLSKNLLMYNHQKALNALVDNLREQSQKVLHSISGIDDDLGILNNIKLSKFSDSYDKLVDYRKKLSNLKKVEEKLINTANNVLSKIYDDKVEREELNIDLT